MARIQVSGTAINRDAADDKLKIVPNGLVKAYQAGTSTEISLYDSESAGSPGTIETDDNGDFSFWVDITHANKRIKIEVTKTGYDTVTVDNYQIWMNINALTEETAPQASDIYFIEDSEDGYNQKKVKHQRLGSRAEYFQAPLWTGSLFDYAVASVSDAASVYFSFFAPDSISAISDAKLIFICQTTGSSKDLDLYSDYGAVGEDYNQHSESDTTSTYSWDANKIVGIDISGVFSSLAAGDRCGLKMTNNSGLTLKVLGVRIKLTI